MANEHSYNLKDASLQSVVALSNGAGTTSTAGFDLGLADAKLAPCELQIDIGALDATAMPTATTCQVTVNDDTNDSGYTTRLTLPTATSSSGIAAQSFRVAIPSNFARYVNCSVILANGGGTVGDCSGVNVTASLVF